MENFAQDWSAPLNVVGGGDGVDDTIDLHGQSAGGTDGCGSADGLSGSGSGSDLNHSNGAGIGVGVGVGEIGFEPQTRARSNTWPCPRPENFLEVKEELSDILDVDEILNGSNQQLANADLQLALSAAQNAKKNSSRRNAWGNQSYADLITHAIGSSKDKRLTLSQIYEWMVQNIPYFKDKGDSNSSAGWKNSIRHNLSLHNRFMRVQNEGTGKSSWWMLNPDAKPGKSMRRRSATLETARYEKRRGRVKKRVDQLRQEVELSDVAQSPCSSVGEGLDKFSETPLHSLGFGLSTDFRQRASSNASTCSRLSPIHQNDNYDLEWGGTGFAAGDCEDNLIIDDLAGGIDNFLVLQQQQGFSTASGLSGAQGTAATTLALAPPPYQAAHQTFTLTGNVAQSFGLQTQQQQQQQQQQQHQQQQQCLIHGALSCNCLQHNSRDGLSPSSVTTMSPAYPNSEPSLDSINTYNNVVLDGGPATVNIQTENGTVLLVQQQQQQQLQQQRQQQQQQQNINTSLEGQCLEALNNETQLDEFTLDNFDGGLECNVEELIKQEMSIDGTLDINMPLTAVDVHTSTGAAISAAVAVAVPATSTVNNIVNIVNINIQAEHQQQQQQQQHLAQFQAQLQQQQLLQQQQQQQQQLQQQQQQLPPQQPQEQLPPLSEFLGVRHNLGSSNAASQVSLQQYSQSSAVSPPSWVH